MCAQLAVGRLASGGRVTSSERRCGSVTRGDRGATLGKRKRVGVLAKREERAGSGKWKRKEGGVSQESTHHDRLVHRESVPNLLSSCTRLGR